MPEISKKNNKRLLQIIECCKGLSVAHFRKYDLTNKKFYCTYFSVSNQLERIGCTRKDERIIYSDKGKGFFKLKLPFYVCNAIDEKEGAVYYED